jgi:hypothetical protein
MVISSRFKRFGIKLDVFYSEHIFCDLVVRDGNNLFPVIEDKNLPLVDTALPASNLPDYLHSA